jgi:hypothetical protein
MSVTDWVDFNEKNKPQGNALSGGVFVLLVSGLQVGWIFNKDILTFPFAVGHSSLQVIFTYASFYIAGLVGLYAARECIDRLTKTNIYVSCFW